MNMDAKAIFIACVGQGQGAVKIVLIFRYFTTPWYMVYGTRRTKGTRPQEVHDFFSRGPSSLQSAVGDTSA